MATAKPNPFAKAAKTPAKGKAPMPAGKKAPAMPFKPFAKKAK